MQAQKEAKAEKLVFSPEKITQFANFGFVQFNPKNSDDGGFMHTVKPSQKNEFLK